MARLQDILYKVALQEVLGDTRVSVTDVQIDSRKVKKGSLFIAINGTQVDGHNFIDAAIRAGAAAIVCECLPEIKKENVVYIRVKQSQEALGYVATNFYERPSEKIKLIGVTGTNGKTTVATLQFQLFTKLGYKCGLLSTVQNQIGDTILVATHTTPDALSLNSLLQQMVQAGCTYVFMECSSHAIHQYRITGLRFTLAVFTNITHDHLDYHKTFNEYLCAKKMFFTNLPANAIAISNADDKNGCIMLEQTAAKKYYYSLRTLADFKGKILDNSISGLQIMINNIEVFCRMIGTFNAYNLLAVYATAICLEQNKEQVLAILSILTGAEGRFDYFITPKKNIAIVDYAHTPDALENVLNTAKQLGKGFEQIITVVGCGGDRDTTKRPTMAAIACRFSTRVIFTSDNPRTEEAAAILQDMEKGLAAADRRKSLSILDRREAIKTAVALANEEDIVIVAGKGHEKYQEINGVKYPFDDKKILQEMFTLLGK